MSAQVTEAHIARARASGYTTDKVVQMAAQLIANNEASKAERDQIRAGVERLTAACDKFSNDEIAQGHLKARAERAEAEVKKLTGFYNEIVVECGHDRIVREYRQRGELLRDEANRRKEAQAELAAERARLDAMVANCWVVHSEVGGSFSVFSNTCGDYIATAQTYRAAIDAAMKEETK